MLHGHYDNKQRLWRSTSSSSLGRRWKSGSEVSFSLWYSAVSPMAGLQHPAGISPWGYVSSKSTESHSSAQRATHTLSRSVGQSARFEVCAVVGKTSTVFSVSFTKQHSQYFTEHNIWNKQPLIPPILPPALSFRSHENGWTMSSSYPHRDNWAVCCLSVSKQLLQTVTQNKYSPYVCLASTGFFLFCNKNRRKNLLLKDCADCPFHTWVS